MLNYFYYELLNLNDNILPILDEFDIFKYVNQAHFILLSMDKTRIVYQYDFKFHDKFDDAFCRNVHNSSTPLISNKLINYRIWDTSLLLDSNLNKENSFWLAASIFENQYHSNNDYSCIVLFNIFDNAALNNIIKNINAFINENYLIQTMLHINMTIKTYEKLSYDIDSFVEMISKKDIYMPHHMTNVASLCLNVASKLNLDFHQTNILYISALIHDIGKLYIPDKIINKPSTLDEREYSVIKTHSVKGEEIAQTAFLGMELLKDVPQIIRSHHENYDGSGYPDNIVGDNILFLSRILRVCDSVDSMLSRFHYKKSFERSRVMDILIKNSGTLFDPKIVNIMIEILSEDESLDATKLITQPHFFPKAILSFFYKDLEDLISLSGNLIIDSNGIRFIYHNEENRLEKFIPKLIYKATFSFFSQRKLYEYSADIYNTTDDYLSLNNVVFIP
ncbi:MAG: HD-GYP domain-containing protein, partial [Proteocatella sp.]